MPRVPLGMENPALLVLALCVCVARGLGYDPSFHQTHQSNGFQALQKGQGIVSPGRVASRHRYEPNRETHELHSR